MLDYKTFGTKSTDGKEHIYFASHPDDKCYFQKITDDILKIRNCVIWYETDYAHPDDDFERKIGNMKFIVVPVTWKLLNKPSHAMDVEIPFAQKYFVPILPIVMENDAMSIFEKKLGCLHALNPFNNDLFGIPYEEQLKRYVESMLIEDDIIDKINKEFDAKVFLSYRKTDIAEAMMFMKSLHKIEEFRDVSVWYDNYLTPGENYKELLKNVIIGCDAVAFVVTPNIYKKVDNNKPNYVMEHEFPDAIKYNKKILAAQMKEVNIKELYANFKEMPNLVRFDTQSFYDELKKILADKNLLYNTNDDDHNYLIALAYLHGIGVEKDAEMALKILIECSENDYTPATRQIVQMYLWGIGVEADIDKVVEWQKKLIMQCNMQHYLVFMSGHSDEYIEEVCNLAHIYEGCCVYNLSLETYSDVIRLCDEELKSRQTNRLWETKLTAHVYSGKAYTITMPIEKAIEHYQKANESIDKLSDFPEADRYTVLELKALIMRGLANSLYMNNEPQKAMYYAEQAVIVAEEMVRLSNTDLSQVARAGAYASLALAYKGHGKLKEAIDNFDESIAIFNEVLADEKNLSVTMQLLSIYIYMIDTCVEIDTEETLKICNEATAFYQKLTEWSEYVLIRRLGIGLKIAKSKIYLAQGMYNEALKIYDEIYDEAYTIAQTYPNPDCKRDIYAIQLNRGLCCYGLDKYSETEKFLSEAYDEITELMKTVDDILLKIDLIHCCTIFANACIEINKKSKAKKLYKKTIEMGELLNEKMQSVPDAMMWLAVSYMKYGDLQLFYTSKVKYWEKGYAILQYLVENYNEVQRYRVLLDAIEETMN